MVSHRHKTGISVVQTLSLALREKQGKGIDCNGPSISLFSIPSVLRIADDIAKFLESLCTASGSRRACRQSKTLR